jgi:hypothetical protein
MQQVCLDSDSIQLAAHFERESKFLGSFQRTVNSSLSKPCLVSLHMVRKWFTVEESLAYRNVTANAPHAGCELVHISMEQSGKLENVQIQSSRFGGVSWTCPSLDAGKPGKGHTANTEIENGPEWVDVELATRRLLNSSQLCLEFHSTYPALSNVSGSRAEAEVV